MSETDHSRGRILWRDRLPWLILLRALRPALTARLLLCAAAGLTLTAAGWRLFYRMFSGSSDPLIVRLSSERFAEVEGETVVEGVTMLTKVWPYWPWEASLATSGEAGIIPNFSSYGTLGTIASDIAWTVWQLTLPFQFLFQRDIGLVGFMFAMLCVLWTLAVWAFLGGAMTRTVAMKLTRDEAIPWSQASGFAIKHWLNYFTAPLYPLLGVMLATLPLLVLGWIARLWIGTYMAAIFWPLALLAGLFMSLLVLGLFFGWPLMWSTVSVEGNDAFDALSRSYAYTFQRPIYLLFYGLVAIFIGTLGYMLVQFFAAGMINLTAWGVSWGAGNARVLDPADPVANVRSLFDADYTYGTALIVFWTNLIKLIAAGFSISYLWSATTAIYLLLRRDIDSAEMDEVYLEQDERFGLPPLATDQRGVPGVADAPAPA